MPHFIPISDQQQLKAFNIDIENLGKSTGFLGLGRKIYLVYDEQQGGWGVQYLNIIQRILRFTFGFYAKTHKDIVGKRLATLHLECVPHHAQLAERILQTWKTQIPLSPDLSRAQNKEGSLISPLSPFTPEKGESPIPLPPLRPTPLFFQSIYDAEHHCFHGRHPQAEQQMALLKHVLQPADLKNIQRACLFGEWQEMDYQIENAAVRQGKDFKLLEKMAIELPELGNYAFFNARGDGECGYRTIIDGLIYGDCIAQDNIDGLKHSFQRAFDRLIAPWHALSCDLHRAVFEESQDKALIQLERMRDLDIPGRIALLQEEHPFLVHLLSFLRCVTVSQTKILQGEEIEAKVLANSHAKREVLADLKAKHSLTEEEEKQLSYAVENDAFSPLPQRDSSDLRGNASTHARKDQLKQLAKQVSLEDLSTLKRLVREEDELSNKQNILAAPWAEMQDMGISMDEFLKKKALANSHSPRGLWALGADFVAIGYALEKNICCLYRNPYRENAFDIQKTYRYRPADFYGLNLTGQIHYNALLPLICSS